MEEGQGQTSDDTGQMSDGTRNISKLRLEIAHVLFIDIVGYSKPSPVGRNISCRAASASRAASVLRTMRFSSGNASDSSSVVSVKSLKR
jgi:hypothetical protein